MTEFDFSGEEAWKGTPLLGPGKHTVTVEDIEEGESSGGHPQVQVELASDEGQIRDWIVLTAGSLGRLLMLTEAAGLDNPGKVKIPSKEWSAYVGQLGHKRVRIFVQEQEYQGETKNRVVSYEAPGQEASDVPADTAGLPVGAGAGKGTDDEVPF